MATPQELGCYPAAAFEWVVTYRYQLQAPWGGSQQEFTANIPPLRYDFEATKRFAWIFWSLAVARATSVLCRVGACTVTAHNGNAAEIVPPPGLVFGSYPSSAAGRDETAGIVMHTGGADDLTLRRFPFPGTPSQWVNGKLLSPTGRRILEQTMQGWKMAMSAELGSPYIRWMVKYQDYDAGPGLGIMSLGFRDVLAVRVLHHTVRAPDPSLG